MAGLAFSLGVILAASFAHDKIHSKRDKAEDKRRKRKEKECEIRAKNKQFDRAYESTEHWRRKDHRRTIN